jgi:acyl dehydratase
MDLSTIKPGDELAVHVAGPISRFTLAMFAGGSGDHNPNHIDSDFAKAAGMPDVFAHGMLSMAYLAQLLTGSFSQDRLRAFEVRFAAITPVGATVTCTGSVEDVFEAEGERRARIALKATIDDGAPTLVGEAIVALP